MLLSIQFPLADSRAFLPQKPKLLARPTWPSPSVDPLISDFVRSFGIIRKRRLGGLRGWVGENAVCEADRALRFSKIGSFKDAERDISIPLRLAFRRFYFDGTAVGKLEVGVSTAVNGTHDIDLSRTQTKQLIEYFLTLPVTIPALSSKAVTENVATGAVLTQLAKAGRPLARFYSACTIEHPPPVNLQDWWVSAGSPLLFLVYRSAERIRIPFSGKIVPRSEALGCDLSCYEVPYSEKGQFIRLWAIGLTDQADYRDVRALKICLLRLHAEVDVLRLIGRNIATGKIDIAPFTNESNALQQYLRDATRRISRLSSQAEYLAEDEIAELARESEDAIDPGERDQLLAFLHNLGVRKNIFYKVKTELKQENHYLEVYMEGSSKFSNVNSTIGVQGDDATVNNLSQVIQSGGELYANWSQAGGDLGALGQDLAKLRTELGVKAKDGEQFEAAAAIAKAEDAANKGDGSAVFDYLKKAGKWALSTATTIGATVAEQALKHSLGI